MRCLLLVALLCLGAGAGAVGANPVTPPPVPKPDVKCGAYCLFVGLRALDLIQGPFAAFERDLGPPGPAGYALADLERFAQSRGATTLAVSTDLDTLRTLRRPSVCIAHLNDHFVIVRDHDEAEHMVTLIDPPREYKVENSVFRSRYTGHALILAATPTIAFDSPRRRQWLAAGGGTALLGVLGFVVLRRRSRSRASRAAFATALLIAVGLGGSGCNPTSLPPSAVAPSAVPAPIIPAPAPPPVGLQIEPAVHQIGSVYAANPRRTITAVTRLINPTERPIHLREIRKSCVCTEAVPEATTIPPGGEVKLTATFKLRHEPGPMRVTLDVVADDAPDELRPIAFEWATITPLVADATQWDAGRLEPGQTAHGTIPLRDRGLALCPSCRVKAEPSVPQFTAQLNEVRATEVASHPATDAPGPEQRLGDLTLTVVAGAEAGDHHQAVDVSIECGGEDRARLTLPIHWAVRPDVSAQPERLMLGLFAGGSTVDRAVTLVAANGQPFTLGSVQAEPPELASLDPVAAESAPTRSVALRFRLSDQPGPHRGAVRFLVRGAREQTITLPVSYVIRPTPPSTPAEATVTR